VSVSAPGRPLVTVGIPFWNEERWLGDAVRSILGQTDVDLELLLVDDGSTDRSLEIARSFRDPRVRVLSDGVRRCLPARLNEIVRNARGEFVARMDGDDVSHPHRLRAELDALDRAGEGCAGVGTWIGLVDEDGKPFAVVEADAGAAPRAVLERGLLPHATLVARRSWLAAHPYDETLTRAEDRDLWCRAVGHARFTVVPEPLYAVRVIATRERFLDDYLETQRQNRMLFRRYGRELLGARGRARIMALSHAKGLAMRVATLVGAVDRLVHRRGRPPTDDERRRIEEALAQRP
jgi:glycosyltransferase involved in cell wall biosynthesis